MSSKTFALACIFILGFAGACRQPEKPMTSQKISVILDTDANNELDDQHAMAYLFFNQSTFDIKGVTVNTTRGGGNIDSQYAEAERVMKLCEVDASIPLLKGADKSFREIAPTTDSTNFDGHHGVDFILKEAKEAPDKLLVIAVGKLTNLALALKKDSALVDKLHIVWLGSNYPDPGEYNLENDTSAMNYVLNTNVEFEMVTVRYGKPSGTAAVKLLQEDARKKMPGLGPKIKTPIEGRHGGQFNNFGDYSVNLFEHIHYDGNPPARALFDMAAVAIVKNPSWAEYKTIPAPIMINNVWVDRPGNSHTVRVWENFKAADIMNDFFESLGYHN